MHLTQKPINLVSKQHSSSAEARTTLGIGTGGKEGECLRKQNKTKISAVFRRTPCWETPTGSKQRQIPACLTLREMIKLRVLQKKRRLFPRRGFSSWLLLPLPLSDGCQGPGELSCLLGVVTLIPG